MPGQATLSITLTPVALETSEVVVEATRDDEAYTPVPGMMNLPMQDLERLPSFPGETMFTTSDIGWVVGHSYIIYGP